MCGFRKKAESFPVCLLGEDDSFLVVPMVSRPYIGAVDFVSHALWGGAAFGRKNRASFLLAVGISILPDVLTEGLFGVLHLMNVGGMPRWEQGHPNITDYPMFAQNLYNATHSLVIFVIVFVLSGIVTRRPVWIIAAWGLHILIDIPTHSLVLFPTPFLWPISDVRINGIDWDTSVVWTIDLVLLIIVYSAWFFPTSRRKWLKSKN